MSSKNLLFLADSDSQLRPAYLMASRIADKLGWTIAGNVVPGRTNMSRRQLMAANVECGLTFLSYNALVERLLGFDAILVFLPGSRLHNMRSAVETAVGLGNPKRRPLLVTGYNGVVYEKHLEGLLWRTGYDLIGVNSAFDEAAFREQLAHFPHVNRDTLVRCGLLLAQGSDNRIDEVKQPLTREVRKVMFACQAIVPEPKTERLYLLDQLRRYALTHPDRTVYIKPRTLPDEFTFHKEAFHYEELWNEQYGEKRPPNLHFAYGSFGSYLKSIDLLVTVSSTAVFEAMVAGVRGAVLSDCGVKETFGNHFFLGSGLMTTMNELIDDRLPQVSSDWLAQHGFGAEDTLDHFVDRFAALDAEQDALGRPLPLPPAGYGAANAPYVTSRFLPKDKAPAPPPPPPPAPRERLYRKARKLVKNPSRFFSDALKKRS